MSTQTILPALLAALIAGLSLHVAAEFDSEAGTEFSQVDLITEDAKTQAATPGALPVDLPQPGDEFGQWLEREARSQLQSRLDSGIDNLFPPVQGGSDSAEEALLRGLRRTGQTVLAEAAQQIAANALTGGEIDGLDTAGLADSAARGLAEAVKQALGYSDYAGLANIEIDAGVSGEGDPRLSLLTLQPLFESEGSRHNLFFQGSLGYERKEEVDRTTLNLGLGYRHLSADERYLYGLNAFYDHEMPYDHQRLSLGIEAESSLLRLGANLYEGLTGWLDTKTYYQEKALNGFDVQLAGRLPRYPEWELALTGYQWNREEGLSDIEGYKADIEYTPVPALAIKVGVDDNDSHGLNWQGTLAFKYRFDVPLVQQFKPATRAELLSLKNRRFRKVERENFIRTQVRQHPDTIATITRSMGVNTVAGAVATVGMSVLFYSLIVVKNTVPDPASLELTFGDGAFLEIGDGSTVEIREGSIHLISGVMRYTSNGTTRKLTTPDATVTLSGTVVELYDEGSYIVARLIEGAMTLTIAGGSLSLSTGAGGDSAACSTYASTPELCSTGDAYEAMEQAVHGRIDSDQITFDVPEMVPINANGESYWMGCHTETSENDLKMALGTTIYADFQDGYDHTDYYDANCESDEQPLHKITFGYNFEVSKYEITFDEWDACVADEGCAYVPHDEGHGSRPVIEVSWNDITGQYLHWLNEKTGKTYRLLTESEWEYVARAGTTTPYNTGETITCGAPGSGNANCKRVVGSTVAVGSYSRNDFDLYDMHGNVWEWVQDTSAEYESTPTDGSAQSGGDHRVYRGGSWYNSLSGVHSAHRVSSPPSHKDYTIGFRVARTTPHL